MRINPESVFLQKNIEIKNFPVFLTGEDESYIKDLERVLIKKFSEEGFDEITRSNNINEQSKTLGLFGNKSTFVVSGFKSLDLDDLKGLDLKNSKVIISSKSSKGNKKIKEFFLKHTDYILIECYPLKMETKGLIIKHHAYENNIKIPENIFFFLKENLDDRYSIFINDLKKILLLKNKINNIDYVRNSFFNNQNININSVLFSFEKNNTSLVSSYNKIVYSLGDFYSYLGVLKYYFDLMYFDTKTEYLRNFPNYLYRQKDLLLKIFINLNKEKQRKINNLFYKAEHLARIYPGQFHSIGLRLSLNLKKIIFSTSS